MNHHRRPAMTRSAWRALQGGLAALSISGASVAVHGQEKVQLWKGPGVHCNRTEIAIEALRCRAVAVKVDAFRQNTPAAELTLAGRPPMTFVLKRSVRSPGGFVWEGVGKGRARATFSVVGDTIVGDIITPDGVPARLRRSSSKRLLVEVLDLSKLNRVEPPSRVISPTRDGPRLTPVPTPPAPPEPRASGVTPDLPVPNAPTPPAPRGGASAPEGTPLACADDGSMIDVLVLYTNQSIVEASSEADVKAQINKAEAVTNWSFDDSQVKTHIRLVHQASIAYAHDSEVLGTILDVLTNPTNTGTNDADSLDSVHPLREAVGADIVLLIVSQPANAIGLSNPMVSPLVGPAFSPLALGVVTYQGLALPYGYVFSHELGHIMGSNHENLAGGAAPYSHGMSGAAQGNCPGWATIMAQPACTGCTALGMWSTPLLFGQCGQKLGDAIKNDNARSLNDTRTVVAQFKCAKP